ncbi:hypothetical protein CEK26_010196 [Fusarium fujikuroi]|nr:hypothetical protein CEK27_010214 [Fusarium fujikuroi]QGI83485.1 hypothetical protein CEK25_010214 [Fusarium fujikuroi]QGI97127.1 hypothetical protein CEK26_010196 [Fusarium fujikuroi]VZH99926.1 unnamed protein product [Fusarium fujikuroi]
MAGPKPRATPATVVEVADEGGVVILSDDPVNSLTVDGLPMGVLKDANKQTAAQIVEMFKEKAPGTPREVHDNILSIYGLGKLNASAAGAAIRGSVQRRYGGDIGTDLTWRNHLVDQGQHARHLLIQLATRFGKLQRTIDKQQETVYQQQKTIQKLVEERQQGLTGHNQDASQTVDYDEEMEKWARYYGYGDEDED